MELSNIHWTFTSSQSNSAQDITMSSNSRLSFSEDLLLLNVSDIVDNVEGTYTLTASNPAGVSNDSVILNVEGNWVFPNVIIVVDSSLFDSFQLLQYLLRSQVILADYRERMHCLDAVLLLSHSTPSDGKRMA